MRGLHRCMFKKTIKFDFIKILSPLCYNIYLPNLRLNNATKWLVLRSYWVLRQKFGLYSMQGIGNYVVYLFSNSVQSKHIFPISFCFFILKYTCHNKTYVGSFINFSFLAFCCCLLKETQTYLTIYLEGIIVKIRSQNNFLRINISHELLIR